jgi:NAD(P)-dependent dehydrogenase (short-subunit alcohol dehydrogenase family)
LHSERITMTYQVEGSRASYDFAGRTAIITGSAQGIGRTIAEGFARAGAAVVIADRNVRDAESTAAEIVAGGADARAFQVDVTSGTEVDALIAFAQSAYGGLSILVNNAAISTTKITEETDEDSWRRVIDINLTGPFLTSKAALPVMRANGGGKIVNIASVAAKRISFNAASSYTASKAGLLAFTRHLAYEAAPHHINVNAICPGPVLSPMLHRTASEETLRAREASVPAGRLTTPQDQTDAVLFLASASADMINGVALDIDGGALLGWYDVAKYYERRGAQNGEV